MTAQPFGKRKMAPPAPASSKFPAKIVPAARPVFATSSPAERNASLSNAGERAAGSRSPGTPSERSGFWAFLFESKLPELREDQYPDLATFFGSNADRFLSICKMPANQRTPRNWPAFILGFVWFFYRKMYLIGALFVVLPLVLAFLLPIGGIATSVVAGILGNRLYIAEAIRRVKKADDLALTGEERTEYLKRAGGVSVAAGTIAAFFYVGIIILAVRA
jgi:hypothetical protein